MAYPADASAKPKRGKEHKFKNLPTVSVTPSSVWHIAEEFNVFAGSVLANTSVDYGYSSGWNIGLSLLNVGLYEQTAVPLWDPDILINVEKSFPLAAEWTLVAGTQNGAAFWDTGRSGRVESYSYLDNQFSFDDYGVHLHLGGYIASGTMAGAGDRAGYLIGVQIPLRGERLALSVDYLSGNNALGTGTIQLLWQVSPHLRVDVGAQTPAAGSSNPYGALLGLAWQL